MTEQPMKWVERKYCFDCGEIYEVERTGRYIDTGYPRILYDPVEAECPVCALREGRVQMISRYVRRWYRCLRRQHAWIYDGSSGRYCGFCGVTEMWGNG